MVVTSVEPVLEPLRDKKSIVRAEVIPEDHPSHSSQSSQSKSKSRKKRTSHHRSTVGAQQQQQQLKKDSGTSRRSLVVDVDEGRRRGLHQIFRKALLLLVATVLITLYQERTYVGSPTPRSSDQSVEKERPGVLQSGGHPAATGSERTTANPLSVEKDENDEKPSREAPRKQSPGFDHERAPVKVEKPKPKPKPKINQMTKDFWFPDRTGSVARYYTIGADAVSVFDSLNRRALKEGKKLAWLGDTAYVFVLGVDGDQHHYPKDDDEKAFLLCHKPLGRVADEIGIAFGRDRDGGDARVLRHVASTATRRRTKPKHTLSGTPFAKFVSEDDDDDEEDEADDDDDDDDDEKDVVGRHHHTIRDEEDAARAAAAVHAKARDRAFSQGLHRPDPEGYCETATASRMRIVHHLRTNSDGKFVHRPPRTGSPYEGDHFADGSRRR